MTEITLMPRRDAAPKLTPEAQLALQKEPTGRFAAIIDVARQALDELAREPFPTIRQWTVTPNWWRKWLVGLADRWAPPKPDERPPIIAAAALDEISAMTGQDWRTLKRVTPVRDPWSPYVREIPMAADERDAIPKVGPRLLRGFSRPKS